MRLSEVIIVSISLSVGVFLPFAEKDSPAKTIKYKQVDELETNENLDVEDEKNNDRAKNFCLFY